MFFSKILKKRRKSGFSSLAQVTGISEDTELKGGRGRRGGVVYIGRGQKKKTLYLFIFALYVPVCFLLPSSLFFYKVIYSKELQEGGDFFFLPKEGGVLPLTVCVEKKEGLRITPESYRIHQHPHVGKTAKQCARLSTQSSSLECSLAPSYYTLRSFFLPRLIGTLVALLCS